MRKLLTTLLSLVASAALAQSPGFKISALPAGTTVSGTDLSPCVQNGTTAKCTMAQLAAYFGIAGGVNWNVIGSGTNVGTLNVGSGGILQPTGTGQILASGIASANALVIGPFAPGGLLCSPTISSLASSGTLLASTFIVGGGPGGCPQSLGGTGVPFLNSGIVSVLSYLPAANGGLGATLNPNGNQTNTAVGITALNAYVGVDSTGIGFQALLNTTSGNSNTCGGATSCIGVTTGAANTAWGEATLTGGGFGFPVLGSNNTAIGFRALTITQGSTGNNNTALGTFAGAGNTTGSGNTYLGAYCGQTVTGTLNDVIALGDSTACAPTASHTFTVYSSSGVLISTVNTVTPGTTATTVTGTLGTTTNTIASLPSCAAGIEGQFSFVTNGQTTPPYLGTVSTTGAVVAPVFCNGTVWVYH